MLLAVNIGNTNITLGVFESEKLLTTFKILTKSASFEKEFDKRFEDYSKIDGVVLGSVVPEKTPVIIETFGKLSLPNPIIINSKINLPIKVNVDYPDKVGADLIANISAAQRIYSKDLIILDSGTATTFCILSKDGIFSGAVIAIGLEVMSNSLSQNGSLLPQISIKKPGGLIGKNTIEAMQAGIYWGYIDLVKGMIKRIKNQMGNALIIGTGGNMEFIAKDIKEIDIINNGLTLEGLRIIYTMNT